MKTNYFNSAVIIPTVTASKQHAAAFADGDVLFSWTGFEIPKGTAKLLGATIQVRPRINSSQTALTGINLLIARGTSPDTNPNNIGNINSGIIAPREADIIAHLKVNPTSDVFGKKTIFQSTISSCETVIEPNPNSGSNIGVDKFYITGLATDSMSMGSDMTVDGTPATNQAVLTVADVFGTLGFAKGDVIHDEDDRLMGTAKLVDDTDITLEANLANAGVNDKKLYNINPIRIILHFSK